MLRTEKTLWHNRKLKPENRCEKDDRHTNTQHSEFLIKSVKRAKQQQILGSHRETAWRAVAVHVLNVYRMFASIMGGGMWVHAVVLCMKPTTDWGANFVSINWSKNLTKPDLRRTCANTSRTHKNVLTCANTTSYTHTHTQERTHMRKHRLVHTHRNVLTCANTTSYTHRNVLTCAVGRWVDGSVGRWIGGSVGR